MNKKVRVLLVGAAFGADLHMEGYRRCTDIAEIVAICNRSRDKITKLAERYNLSDYDVYDDFRKAIDETDCDVVDICLPNFLHHEVALYALRKGRHVIIEKPLALNVKQGEELLRAAEEAGKHIYYAEDWNFAPAIVRALQILDEGAIGDLMLIRARESHSGSHSPYAQTIEYCGGGCMIHLGIHPIGLALALKKNEWVSVTASTSGGGEKNLMHKKMEGEDFACCTMEFSDGTRAIIEANYVTIGGMEDIIDLYGTQGCLHVDINFGSQVSCFSIPGVSYTIEKAAITTGWSKPAVDEKYNLGYVDEIRHFMNCILTGSEAKVGLRGIDGVEALKVVEAIYKSARENRTVFNPRYKPGSDI